MLRIIIIDLQIISYNYIIIYTKMQMQMYGKQYIYLKIHLNNDMYFGSLFVMIRTVIKYLKKTIHL